LAFYNYINEWAVIDIDDDNEDSVNLKKYDDEAARYFEN
jgi:hypothetical protein